MWHQCDCLLYRHVVRLNNCSQIVIIYKACLWSYKAHRCLRWLEGQDFEFDSVFGERWRRKLILSFSLIRKNVPMKPSWFQVVFKGERSPGIWAAKRSCLISGWCTRPPPCPSSARAPRCCPADTALLPACTVAGL